MGTSFDSAMVGNNHGSSNTNNYPKNRFLSGDINNREAYIRRQLISIGKDILSTVAGLEYGILKKKHQQRQAI